MTLNLNINERIRQEFVELLTLNTYQEQQNTRKQPINVKPEIKPKLITPENKVPIVNEQQKNIINNEKKPILIEPKKNEKIIIENEQPEEMFDEEDILFTPGNDFDPIPEIQEKPLYNIEMPLYQEQNKEMFLKYDNHKFMILNLLT